MTMHFVGVVAEAIIAIMWVPLIDAVVFGLGLFYVLAAAGVIHKEAQAKTEESRADVLAASATVVLYGANQTCRMDRNGSVWCVQNPR